MIIIIKTWCACPLSMNVSTIMVLNKYFGTFCTIFYCCVILRNQKSKTKKNLLLSRETCPSMGFFRAESELLLDDLRPGGVGQGVLKLVWVTYSKKASSWRNDKELCNVSRGRMLGIPEAGKNRLIKIHFLLTT